jgi:guanylate kinase
MDGSNYQPAPHVLDRLKQVDFVAVIAPTATGKTVTIQEAAKWYPMIHQVPALTSRAPRPGEQDGRDYLFRSREEMEVHIARGEYVQVAPNLFGYLYATEPEGYSIEGVAVLPILAEAVPVFRQLPFKSIKVICMTPPSWEVWQQRLKSHSFTLDQLKSRIREAVDSMRFGLNDDQTLFIVDDSLQLAAEDFATLALGKPMPERLKADQQRARDIVRGLLDRFEAETQSTK